MDDIIYVGARERSDCHIGLEVKYAQGIDVTIKGETKGLYGEEITQLTKKVLLSFDIEHARVTVEDFGALPFTLMARLETAAKQAYTIPNKVYLPPKEKTYDTTKDRLRRSCIYLPAKTSRFFVNAPLHKPDGVIFDLNTSKKTATQILVRNALINLDFYGAEKMICIQPYPEGLEDLEQIMPYCDVHMVLIPRCETAKQIQEIAAKISQIKEKHNIATKTFLMPVIESALGVINAYKIAISSDLNAALALDLKGYLLDIGGRTTSKNKESYYARSAVVNAARAAKIQAIDSVLTEAKEAKALGFTGKGCEDLQQIPIINKTFFPTKLELGKAITIVIASEQDNSEAIKIASKAIDPYIVKKSLQMIELVVKEGCLTKNWREEWKKELLCQNTN